MSELRTKLSNAALTHLSSQVKKPQYDRETLDIGIVHVGVGGFHRAHQAYYIDQLIALGNHNHWGICGVGLLPSDQKMHDALTEQDYLYTLIQKDKGLYSAQLIGSIIDYIHAPSTPDIFHERLVNPATKIVSLTITEGGYCFDDVTLEFIPTHPDIQHDLTTSSTPKTIFGYIFNALKERREKNIEPFTIMSCDNIQTNGDVAKKVFIHFATLKDKDLANWMAEHVCFPNSMVDRITPATTDEDRLSLEEKTQLSDQWPVITEPFTQWVLEDSFSNGRPEFEKTNIILTENVLPYEKMKIRLLNASHQLIGFLGLLTDLTYVHEVLENSIFEQTIRKLMDEVTVLIDPVPGVDLTNYKNSLIERFSNPTINDQLTRICTDTSARMPKFLIPSIEDAISEQSSFIFLSFAVACWIKFWTGQSESGATIPLNDPLKDTIKKTAGLAQDDPKNFLELSQLFSNTIKTSEPFYNCTKKHLENINNYGITSYIEKLISN